MGGDGCDLNHIPESIDGWVGDGSMFGAGDCTGCCCCCC